MMEVSKVELKILIKEFLTASNRMLRADYLTYASELKKFITFLESKPIINDYIIACGEPEYNVKEEVDEVNSSYGNAIFSLGETKEKEVANIYAVIKYLALNNYNGRSYVYYGYSVSKKYQDKVDGFGDRFIRILIMHIENYLSTMSIKMGADEKMAVQFKIENGNFNNSQFNISAEGSFITATQNNSSQLELSKLIENLKNATNGMSEEDLETVNDCVEVIETLKEEKPKKGILKTALNTLKGIVGTAEFVAAVAEIAQYVQNYI